MVSVEDGAKILLRDLTSSAHLSDALVILPASLYDPRYFWHIIWLLTLAQTLGMTPLEWPTRSMEVKPKA